VGSTLAFGSVGHYLSLPQATLSGPQVNASNIIPWIVGITRVGPLPRAVEVVLVAVVEVGAATIIVVAVTVWSVQSTQ